MATRFSVEHRRKVYKIGITFECETLYDAFLDSLSRSSDMMLNGIGGSIRLADKRAEESDSNRGTSDAREML